MPQRGGHCLAGDDVKLILDIMRSTSARPDRCTSPLSRSSTSSQGTARGKGELVSPERAIILINRRGKMQGVISLWGLDECNRLRGRAFRLRALHELHRFGRAARKLQQHLQLRELFGQPPRRAGEAATRT